MGSLEQLLLRHQIDPSKVELALRHLLEPTVPLTAGQLAELGDSGLDLYPRMDTNSALADEMLRQQDITNSFTGAEVAVNNQISAGRVRSKAAAGELVFVLVDGIQRFPRFQFDDQGAIRPGLDKVSPHIPDEWSWMGYRNYLVVPAMELDGRTVTPIEWLAAGKPPVPVIAAMGNNW